MNAGPGEDALGILHQRRRGLAQFNPVVVQAPQERRDGDVEHGEVVAQHVLGAGEHRRELDQAVGDVLARLVDLLLLAALERVDLREELDLHVEEHQARPRAHHRVRRHELRVREALVDVLVDDVRLVQDEVALDQHGQPVVRVHDGDVLGLVVEVDVDHLEVHALLVEHEPAAVAERAGRARIQLHHGGGLGRKD